MSKAFVGKAAPEFKATSYYKGDFKSLSLADFKGKYLVLFFYPFDFTFVCPTEILSFSHSAAEFRKIGCEVVGCSIDSHFVHMQWCKTPLQQGGLGDIDIPLLADIDKQISKDYGVLIDEGDNKGAAFRGTVIIDRKGTIRMISIQDLPVGRNPDETLRLVQGYQFSDEHGEVCPAKWKPGAKTMKPDWKSAELKEFWEKEHGKK